MSILTMFTKWFLLTYQFLWTQDLQSQIDYPYFDIEGCVQLFLEWEHNKVFFGALSNSGIYVSI